VEDWLTLILDQLSMVFLHKLGGSYIPLLVVINYLFDFIFCFLELGKVYILPSNYHFIVNVS
jgi:hypothetical protein